MEVLGLGGRFFFKERKIFEERTAGKLCNPGCRVGDLSLQMNSKDAESLAGESRMCKTMPGCNSSDD